MITAQTKSRAPAVCRTRRRAWSGLQPRCAAFMLCWLDAPCKVVEHACPVHFSWPMLSGGDARQLLPGTEPGARRVRSAAVSARDPCCADVFPYGCSTLPQSQSRGALGPRTRETSTSGSHFALPRSGRHTTNFTRENGLHVVCTTQLQQHHTRKHVLEHNLYSTFPKILVFSLDSCRNCQPFLQGRKQNVPWSNLVTGRGAARGREKEGRERACFQKQSQGTLLPIQTCPLNYKSSKRDSKPHIFNLCHRLLYEIRYPVEQLQAGWDGRDRFLLLW